MFARALAAWLACALFCMLALGADGQPRVRLIATGGTIANHRDGRLDAAPLAASVPALASRAQLETETFANTASLGLTLDDWLRLSRRVAAALRDPGLAGVVVTTGTDTLEELAWFLDLTVGGERPVVVTGALRRPTDEDADGPRNLLDAVTVAADPAAGARGTLVVMHGLVLAARDATKVGFSPSEAFEALSMGPLGHVEEAHVRFAAPPGAREPRPPFEASSLRRLPRVDVLLTYQQSPGDLISAAVRGGAEGIVLASAGLGSVTQAQADAIARARAAGTIVVISSRVERGAVTTTDVSVGAIPAGALTPVKARILLMLALARGMSRKEIAEVFRQYGAP